MPAIIVAPLEHVEKVVLAHEGAHVCGLLGPEMMHPPLPVPEARRLRLSFHDVAAPAPGFRAPAAEDVARILDFTAQWAEEREGPLVFHCWAGISRSWAAAFIARCRLEPGRPEGEIARELRRIAPFATPNPRLVRLADDLLGRQGRMIEAIAAISRGQTAFMGAVVHWPLPSAG